MFPSSKSCNLVKSKSNLAQKEYNRIQALEKHFFLNID